MQTEKSKVDEYLERKKNMGNLEKIVNEEVSKTQE